MQVSDGAHSGGEVGILFERDERSRCLVQQVDDAEAVEGWPADRAFAEMKQHKFGADFLHPEFKTFVYAYHPSAAAATMAGGTG